MLWLEADRLDDLATAPGALATVGGVKAGAILGGGFMGPVAPSTASARSTGASVGGGGGVGGGVGGASPPEPADVEPGVGTRLSVGAGSALGALAGAALVWGVSTRRRRAAAAVGVARATAARAGGEVHA